MKMKMNMKQGNATLYVKRVLYRQERLQNTNHSEKRSKDDQSDHPESYDNEDRALAVENSSKSYGASYR